ncbi:hypothetical protein COLO4_20826, partial [Corchorus olitorius]
AMKKRRRFGYGNSRHLQEIFRFFRFTVLVLLALIAPVKENSQAHSSTFESR